MIHYNLQERTVCSEPVEMISVILLLNHALCVCIYIYLYI